MEKLNTTIYLDVHGVLADFVGAVGSLYDVPNLPRYWLEHGRTSQSLEHVLDSAVDNKIAESKATNDGVVITLNDIHNAIDEKGSIFWSDSILEYDWARDLYRYLIAKWDVVLISSPSPTCSSAAGIMQWMYDFTRKQTKDFMLCPSGLQYKLSRPGCVLIDDHRKAVDDFNTKGTGKGILFPMPWNTSRKMGGFIEVVKVLHEVERYMERIHNPEQVLNADIKEPI